MDTKSTLQHLIEDAGYEARSYSGRAMYGKECIAVDIDCSPFEFFADVLERFDVTDEMKVEEVKTALTEALRSARTDSMGRGQVVYFPGTEYFDEDQEGTEEADDKGSSESPHHRYGDD